MKRLTCFPKIFIMGLFVLGGNSVAQNFAQESGNESIVAQLDELIRKNHVRSIARCKTDQLTPIELLYAGNFDEAQAAYQLILTSDSEGEVVNDGELADTALLLYWDLVEEKGRVEAKKYARKTLEIAIELFDEAPMSEYSLRFYR